MIKQFMFCNHCDNNISEQIEEMERNPGDYITIDGEFHYCDNICKKLNQEKCEHKNSIKSEAHKDCLDCGLKIFIKE